MSLCTGLGKASASSCSGSRVVDRHWTVFLCCEATVICRNAYFSVFCSGWFATAVHQTQLSATDVSARTTMKGAAKCDKHCELQNSVNRQGLERILCFWDIPESMPASVSTLCCSSSCRSLRGMLLAISCASGRAPFRRS